MGILTFQIPNEQHREWFVVGLFSQLKALEIVIKLEAPPIGDGAEME
jgi:hypothetical protein